MVKASALGTKLQVVSRVARRFLLRSRRLAGVVRALAVVSMLGVGSCSSASQANGDASGNWAVTEAEIYLSAMDSLLAGRFPKDSVWFVADTIYWWPMSGPRPHLALEETSAALRIIGREQGRSIVIVPLDEAIAHDGSRRVPGPLVILGPIDMLNQDGAQFRVNLYLGLHGQELNRFRCRRLGGKWRVVEVSHERAT
jgi:hypothetical protein